MMMRTFVFWLIVASVATTALADPQKSRNRKPSEKKPVVPAHLPIDDELLALPKDDRGMTVRKWHNETGDKSIDGGLSSASFEIAKIVKPDGKIVDIPLKMLDANDRQFVASTVLRLGCIETRRAIESFLKISDDDGDTDARIAESENIAADKLLGQVNGRKIRVTFPVDNIRPSDNPRGTYMLTLKKPDFPGTDYAFKNYINKSLTKDTALAVGRDSSVVIEGRLAASIGTVSKEADGDRLFAWSRKFEKTGMRGHLKMVFVNIFPQDFIVVPHPIGK